MDGNMVHARLNLKKRRRVEWQKIQQRVWKVKIDAVLSFWNLRMQENAFLLFKLSKSDIEFKISDGNQELLFQLILYYYSLQ